MKGIYFALIVLGCSISEGLIIPAPLTTKISKQKSTQQITILHARRQSALKEESEKVDEQKDFFFPWSSASNDMKDQVILLDEKGEEDSSLSGGNEGFPTLAILATLFAVGGVATISASSMDVSLDDISAKVQEVASDPSAALDQVVSSVESMGTLGAVYFGVAYTIAEILAIPAIPLTASAGYLFGPVQGTSVVLLSASVAAAISFVIGRTLLRTYVERVLEDYPKFAKIDRAIGKEGFKLMLLLRLSPVFPFALSNYLYGASSISFNAFFFGTLFGFAPGTMAYVYTGYIGKALTDGGEDSYPWFVYAGGLAIFAGLLKVIADTATRIVEELEDED